MKHLNKSYFFVTTFSNLLTFAIETSKVLLGKGEYEISGTWEDFISVGVEKYVKYPTGTATAAASKRSEIR